MLALACCAACAGPQPDRDSQIGWAVQATLQSFPGTDSKSPPTPLATATEISLDAVFCEYGFCVGHPQGLPLFDLVAKQNPNSLVASTRAEGTLASSATSVFIEFRWMSTFADPDPAVMLDLILEDRYDVPVGQPEVLTAGPLTAYFVVLETTAAEALPHGGAAAWRCGGRQFAWKVYTARAPLPRQYLMEALRTFRCTD